MIEDKDIKEGRSYIYQDLESGRVKVTVRTFDDKTVTARLEGQGYEKTWAIDTFKKYAKLIP